MFPRVKLFSAVFVCVAILQGCIIDTIVQQMDTVAAEGGTKVSGEVGGLDVSVVCDEDDLVLVVDSVEVCNVLLFSGESPYLYCGCVSVAGAGGTVLLPVQDIVPWNTNALPGSSGAYLKIYGEIFAVCGDGQLFTVCSGPMYHPLSAVVVEGEICGVCIDISPSSPLYLIQDGVLAPALQPISFGAYVQPWR